MTITTYPELRIDALPIGAILPYPATSAPPGFLLCAGQEVSRSTYVDLFTLIGTAFGSGDGSTTFNLPDLRGRSWFGLDNLGGSDAGRLSVANTLGGSGGAQTHTLTESEMPSHVHAGYANYPFVYNTFPTDSGYSGVVGGGGTLQPNVSQTNPTGGGGAHNNMPPYMLGGWIIKAFDRPEFVSAAVADESTLTVSGGIISVRDLGVDTPKLVNQAVTAPKIADAAGAQLAQAIFEPGSQSSNSENANNATLVNAALSVTFTMPSSGAVMVEMSSLMAPSSSAETYWTLFDASNSLITAGTVWMMGAVGTPFSQRLTYKKRMTGTPGASTTYKWAFFRGAAGSAGTFIYFGGSYGPAVMTVRACE